MFPKKILGWTTQTNAFFKMAAEMAVKVQKQVYIPSYVAQRDDLGV